MLVHPVVVPGSGTRSWTVLGDDDVPVVPVDRFLAYLTDIGRSPNTVKAYAHHRSLCLVTVSQQLSGGVSLLDVCALRGCVSRPLGRRSCN